MPRKYILVCHYGSLPKNNLFSLYKSGLLKTQAPPPPPPPPKKKKSLFWKKQFWKSF